MSNRPFTTRLREVLPYFAIVCAVSWAMDEIKKEDIQEQQEQSALLAGQAPCLKPMTP